MCDIETTVDLSKESLIVYVHKKLSHLARKNFSNSYKNADPTIKFFIVDFSHASYIDSSGLGMLLILKEFVAGRGGEVILRNADKEIKELLILANFDKLFRMD